MADVQIIVITCNDERKRIMTTQLDTLRLSYSFFQGYTPASSKEYIVDRDAKSPEKDTMMCCMRSHGGALHHYVTEFPDAPYALIVEDDASLLINLEEELRGILERWKSHEEIDFVSVGYFPMKGGHPANVSDGPLRWNLQSMVWGTQAYLVKRSAAVRMAAVLHQPTSKALRGAFLNYVANDLKGKSYAYKHPCVQPDALLPIGWNQAVVYPMMAIELPINSTITTEDNHVSMGMWEPVFADGGRQRRDFYNIPPPPSAISLLKSLTVAPTLVTAKSMPIVAKKRLIVCADNRSPYEGTDAHWTYCVMMTHAYAKLIGVDFTFHLLKELPHGRHPSWEKIRIVEKHIPSYDEILWIDSDATILNRSVDVFEFIKTAPASEWKRDTSVTPTLYALSDKPFGPDRANAGIFMLDCTNKQKATEVLNEWWNDIGDKEYETKHPWEQSVWNLVWKNTTKASYIRVADVWSVVEKDPRQVFFHAVGAHHNARLSSIKRYFYRQLYPTKKRIGIVVRQQNYYTNGCGQNCIFMMQSLEALGYPVDLLINYKEDKPKFVSESIPLSYIHLTDVRYSDYEAIVFGSEIPFMKDVTEMKRAGVRRIMFNPCNVVDAFHNENFLYSCKSSSLPLLEMTYKDIADEIWLTENHKESSQTYLEVINKNKIPVHVVPLVWSPLFLRSKEGKVPMNKAHTGKALDVVIMEPNIGYCKSGWLPLITCEKLLLENPDAIHQVYLFNAPMNNPTAVGMIESLELWKTKKLRLMTRMPITEILGFFSDPAKHGDYPVAFLSHQINLPLNYAYFDALYTGFAFVHNSPALRDMKMGHYYDDLTSGVTRLTSLSNSYPVETYALEAQSVLQSRDPYNEDCVNTFKQILEGNKISTASIANTVTYSVMANPTSPSGSRILTNESILSTGPASSPPRIQLLVVTASEKRKAILQRQFKELAIPYPIVYLEAKTLDAEAPDYAPANATDIERRSIYSTRSHIHAVELAGLPTSPPFSLILEDDVAFHKTDFVPVLTQILDSYEKCVEPHSGILSVGWIPCNNYSFYSQLANPTILNASYTIHQRFTPGTQAYLIKRSKAAEFTPLFKHTTHKALCKVILEKKHPMIVKDGQVAVFDDFGTKLLDQCILFPPLVVEQPNTSLIRGTDENLYWKQFFQGHEGLHDQYWKSRPSVQSFDVWDTLVARECAHPTDIFRYMQMEYGLPADFQQERMRAESRSVGTLDSIYQELGVHYKWNTEYTAYVKRLEVVTELKYIIPVRANLERVRDGDILVSDMYLPEEAFREILSFIGFTKRVAIYVTPGGKANGTIWPILLQKYIITNHLGDNPKSDVASPTAHTIPAELTTITAFTKAEQKFIDTPGYLTIGHALRRMRLETHFPTQDESAVWFDLVNHVLPVILFFCSFINQLAKAKGLTKIRFMTRDHTLLLPLFTTLYPTYDSKRFLSSRFLNKTKEGVYKEYIRANYDDSTLLVDLNGSFNTGRAVFQEAVGKLPSVVLLSYLPGISEPFDTLYYMLHKDEVQYTFRYEDYSQNYQGKICGFRQTGSLLRIPNEYTYSPLIHRAATMLAESVSSLPSDMPPLQPAWIKQFINSEPLTAIQYVNRGETSEPTNLCVPPRSPLHLSDTTRPLLLSYDNKPTETTEFFMKTLTSNAWQYVLLGKDEVWEGWHTRMNAYRKYLDTLHEDKVVILSDARDVLCLRGPHAFMEAFRSFKKDLVVSMELLCGGSLDVPDTYNCVQCKPIARYWNFYNISPKPLRKYVNNGLIAGTARALRSLLKWSLDNKYTDDQLALGNYVNTFPELVAADTGADLLHTTNFGVNAGIQYIHVQKQDSPSFAELFGRSAFFLHIPGLGGKGQSVLYNSVRKTLEEGACDKQLRSPYKYAEPAWNEVF
jgi:GR25 family glycosyltransferase involved in LPS biosynthesis